MKLHLPYPPSVNQCYATDWRTKRRFKTLKYNQWVTLATASVVAASSPNVRGPVKVLYEIGRPDKRKRDIGNLEKPLSDLLVSAGVIEDDSLIQDLRLVWADVDGVNVTIEGIE